MKASVAGLGIATVWLLGALPARVPPPPKQGAAACAVPSADEIGEIAKAKSVAHCETYLCLVQDASDDVQELLGMGVQYCEDFAVVVRPELSAQGQRWVDEATACLMRDTQAVLLGDAAAGRSVDDFFAFAATSHALCYVETGFCELPAGDQATVIFTLRMPPMRLAGMMWPSTPALSAAAAQLAWGCL